ncbi:unnamed protein product [Amoebophrya sp. A25]|nr:unnamed protein product [Amoebophrya sp. A25]|eukprot:GSA25T00023809001.1
MGNRQSCGGTTSSDNRNGTTASKVPPPPRATEADRAILQMKVQRDTLIQQKKKVAHMANAELEKAKDFLREDKKNLAAFCIKKKTIHEKLVTSCDNALIKLYELIDNVEMTAIQADVVKAMEAGSGVLKKMQQELTLDRVQTVIAESEEFREWNEEIATRMGEFGITNDDIDAELAQIEAEETMKDIDANTQAVPTGGAPAELASRDVKPTIPEVVEEQLSSREEQQQGVARTSSEQDKPSKVAEMVPA